MGSATIQPRRRGKMEEASGKPAMPDASSFAK